MRFSKRKLIFCFCLFYVAARETEKDKENKLEKAKKPYKIVFLRWSSKNEKMKKWIFNRNCLTVSGREKNEHFRVHYLFWRASVFGPAKHSSCKKKVVCWKNRKFMNNGGLFLNMAKRYFVCFFQALLLLWYVFHVSGRVTKVLNMFVYFSQVFGLWGWLILVYLGLEGLGVFVVLVFVFLLFRFVFVCWLCFVLLLDCFGVVLFLGF